MRRFTMKSWRLSPYQLTVGFAGWLVVTNLLAALAHTTDWWPVKGALFLCLSFLPGVALLRAMRATFSTLTAGLLYSFGLSILVLMLSGLAANQLLPLFGVAQPLSLLGILGAWNAVTAILITISITVNPGPLTVKLPERKLPSLAWWLIGCSLVLPCLATFGAFRLNNGGDGLLAAFTLCATAALIAVALVCRRRLPDGVMAWLVFTIGLTILLMTSLRGWDIVGHDIAREFRVYTLTHLHGHWDMSLDRDPYNACLSITILPEMFARLLDVSGLLVFKVILQVIFAACPVVLYVLLRHHVPKLAALVGGVLFICYPTFINDSAMLTRQGVAYLFFALALLVISNKAQEKRYKLLFLLCALGAVLSHYSTAYMFVALFAVAVICKLVVTWWLRRGVKPRPRAERTVVSPLFAGLLLLMTFTWYTQITATSDGLLTTLHTSFANIPKLFSDDNKSSDTSTALLFAGGKSQADLYLSYLNSSQGKNVIDSANITQYIPTLISDDLPLTSVGQKAQAVGIDPSLITTARQQFARFLQLLALAGVVFVSYGLLRRKKQDLLHLDFICLSWAGILLLALMVVLPVLSISYGVLRAFQQSLIFLILPIMLLLVKIGHGLWPRLRTTLATVGSVVLFLLFTGVFAQLLGGTSPSLSMNNRGLYYGLYYAPQTDARAFSWLKQHIPANGDVRTPNFNKALMHDPDFPFTHAGLLPTQIGEYSYTYLDQAQVLTKKIYTYYESSPLIMSFPLEFYDEAKNQIYSTTSTRIYK